MGPNRKRVTHFSELEPVQIRMDEQIEAEKMEPEVTTTVKVGIPRESWNNRAKKKTNLEGLSIFE